MEIIKYLEEVYKTERLDPFEEIPEISKAARNLLINIEINDQKFHNINLKKLNPSILNLRTRLSNYGHRTGRIFETVVFKTNNPEDIVNHILRDENGRNMLLSNKMKFIGIACDILPSNIICTVIDIVQDFIPYKNNEKSNKDINFNNNYNNNLKIKYQENRNYEENPSLIDKINFDNSINNLNFNLDDRDAKIKYYNPKKDVIIDNIKNVQKLSDLFINKNFNQRKNNNFNQNNELYKTPIKLNSMDIPLEKECFSPKSINSYNIIINNKIIPIKKNSNSLSPINKEKNSNKKDIDTNNIFTMAGRTSKEQQEIIEISSKVNLNKSRSFSSFDFKINNSRINNKNKFQRLNQKEKLEILHKINQRNKNQKSLSTNNKNFDSLNIINHSKQNNILFQKKVSNLEINIEDRNKENNNYYFDTQNNIFDNSPDNKSNRFNTFLSKINDSNIVNYCNINGASQIYPFYNESKYYNQNYEDNNEYSKIKNDLLLFKNKIKQELKDEVKNEIKEEIKFEFNINQRKKKPNSINLEESNIDNIINNKQKISNVYQSQNENNENKFKLNNKIYLKKSNSIYFTKNKIKNRSCSEEKIISNNNDKSKWVINNKERKTFESKNYKNNNNVVSYLKNKYKEIYENLNDSPINNNDFNHSIYQSFYNKKNNSSDLVNKIKNRQQIKKLIRLYNIAKDNKRNNNNEDNFYDIINNSKSISNYLFIQNKNNEENNINKFNNNLNNQNNEIKEANKTKNENKEIKKEKKPITNKFIFKKKYEKVKPIGNFYLKMFLLHRHRIFSLF